MAVPEVDSSSRTETSEGGVPRWVQTLGPLVLVGLMVAVFLGLDPIGALREVPPVEDLAVEQAVLRPGEIELRLRNDGRDPVTVSQVSVNEAFWNFTVTDAELSRLETGVLRIAYPWEEGQPYEIAMLTSTGGVITHEIEAAALTPVVDVSTLMTYALLGVYIGVVPIVIGLLWFPALRRARRAWLTFFLAFTLGLLAFLLVDTVAEGLELVDEAASALDGLGLFVLGALAAVLGLTYLGGALPRRRGTSAGLLLAYLIAAGIGLHNLGEGLAVGAALAAGEAALGTSLVLGFALHNTTEGLAIVSPLGGEGATRPSLWHFAGFGALAGGPTILGTWAGGFLFSPAWAAVAFGIAAGAIAQVLYQIGKSLVSEGRLTSGSGVLGLLAGFLFMYATGLFTA